MTADATRHQRGDQVERADAAFDQPPRAAPRADDRHDRRVAADDERGEQQERAEGGHGLAYASCCCRCARTSTGTSPSTPFGSAWNPSGVSVPFSTTSASSLNVSGTTPVYDGVDRRCAVVLHLEPVLERVRACTKIEPGTTKPCSCSGLPSHSWRVRHHFVDVLVVLGAVAQRRPQQAREGERRARRWSRQS